VTAVPAPCVTYVSFRKATRRFYSLLGLATVRYRTQGSRGLPKPRIGSLDETLEQQDGWEVCGEAADGREAIEKAKQLKPDLVVLDLSMPVMNGLEAARKLKSLYPCLPLLMFTNFASPQLTNEALSAGVSAVVSKDKIEGLLHSIQALLEPVS
jgi:DNA-binding NarL/FixJ family response regulator